MRPHSLSAFCRRRRRALQCRGWHPRRRLHRRSSRGCCSMTGGDVGVPNLSSTPFPFSLRPCLPVFIRPGSNTWVPCRLAGAPPRPRPHLRRLHDARHPPALPRPPAAALVERRRPAGRCSPCAGCLQSQPWLRSPPATPPPGWQDRPTSRACLLTLSRGRRLLCRRWTRRCTPPCLLWTCTVTRPSQSGACPGPRPLVTACSLPAPAPAFSLPPRPVPPATSNLLARADPSVCGTWHCERSHVDVPRLVAGNVGLQARGLSTHTFSRLPSSRPPCVTWPGVHLLHQRAICPCLPRPTAPVPRRAGACPCACGVEIIAHAMTALDIPDRWAMPTRPWTPSRRWPPSPASLPAPCSASSTGPCTRRVA